MADLKQRFYLFLAGTILPALIYLLGMTWRVRYVGGEHEKAFGGPLIWAFWHSRQFPLVYLYRRRGIVVLASRSFDGEISSRILNRFGFRTIRGSSSRGGARSLIEALRELKSNARVAFTPDGPRGPKEIAQIGAAAVSVKSGAPIIAAATASNRHWKLSSWDGFRIPKPFARVEIRQSEPIYPSDETIKELNAKLQIALEEVTRLADRSVSSKGAAD